MSFGQQLDELVRVFRPHFCRPNSDRVVPFALPHSDFWRWELALHCGREALPLVSIWPGGGNLVAGIRLRCHANAIFLFWGGIIGKMARKSGFIVENLARFDEIGRPQERGGQGVGIRPKNRYELQGTAKSVCKNSLIPGGQT